MPQAFPRGRRHRHTPRTANVKSTATAVDGSGTTLVVGVTVIETSPLALGKLLTVVDTAPLMLKLKKVPAAVSVVGMDVSPGGGGGFEIKL